MSHNVVLGFLLLSTGALLVTAACSGNDGASAKSVLDSCSGAYLCLIDGDAVDSRLTRVGSRCYLGQIELAENGTSPPLDGKVYTWSGDTAKLDICQGTTCFSCYPSSQPGASSTGTPSATGRCVGSASSCSYVGADSCSDQRGCYYTVGATLSTSDDGCAGSAAPCSDFDNDASGCGTQHGCAWQ